MEDFERAFWLTKLEIIRDEADNGNQSDLAFILSAVYAAYEQGQIEVLKDKCSAFVDSRINELEEELKIKRKELEEMQKEHEIQKSLNGFLYNEEHDSHFPFDENSDIDPNI